jgi:hypothetical protein
MWEFGAVLLALGTAAGAHSQGTGIAAPEGAGSGPRVLLVSPGPATAQKGNGGQVVREICDPHTGKRWLLMRENGPPGGPGRMVLAGDFSRTASADGSGASPAEPGLTSSRAVIRAGDKLIVEEHTSLVEAYLEAVALGPAAAGSTLDVRLKMGGKVVRAVALGPGRAAIQTGTGVKP